jgi:hypothetical protein
MPESKTVSDLGNSRRGVIKRTAVGAGALWTVSLNSFAARQAEGAPLGPLPDGPYGPISPTVDEATGLPLLRLPEGFRYISYSWTGDVMSDGVRCPPLHDGMGIIDELNGSERDRYDREPRRGRKRGKNDNRWDRDDARRGSDYDDDESESGLLVLCRNHEGAKDATICRAPTSRMTPRTARAGTRTCCSIPRMDAGCRRSPRWRAPSGTVPAG